MSDLIKREDAIEALCRGCGWKESQCDQDNGFWCESGALIRRDIPSADRPSEIIYGNEHNCVMTIFGECSYAETGCGDCAVVEKVRKALSADRPQGEWIPCSERLPETDDTNEINEFDVLLAVRPKKHPERTPQVYIGKLRHVEGDDGSGNFWGVKTAPSEWTIWGWSYFQEPEVLAWMPLPKPWKGADDE